MPMRQPLSALIGTVSLLALLAGCRPDAAPQATTPAPSGTDRQHDALPALRAVAREAYVYGVPMLARYRQVHALSIDTDGDHYRGPFNQLSHGSATVPGDDDAQDADAGLPSTSATLDLRAEPVVIGVPPMEPERYFVLQLVDLYGYHFAYIGSRSTGNLGGHYLIAGPDWHGRVPAGITQVMRAETQLVSLSGGIQLLDAQDRGRVEQLQARYRLQPLSAFLGRRAPHPPAAVTWPAPLAPDALRGSPAFFNQLAFVLQFAPIHPSERALRARLAGIGIQPGHALALHALPPDTLAALREGMADGQREIDQRRAALAGRTDTLYGSRDLLKGDLVARATGSQADAAATSRDEALRPLFDTDADGVLLDGSRHRYTVRFARDRWPPVNAFWSLSLYALPGERRVANAIDRHQIDSRMLPHLRRDADGGLTLYLQHDPPPGGQRHNWLPAPDGPFAARMRYYWPKPELLDGGWTSPQIERVH
ncbi:DUF1254 domain-containing protein [Stenotrophomonas sp. PD6]|uniref:DUF1254 domain-containing protein n=1 Tax=Stenotrophomonas sp. PD6 TaxID=3368612 RepID=UPI003BA081DE